MHITRRIRLCWRESEQRWRRNPIHGVAGIACAWSRARPASVAVATFIGRNAWMLRMSTNHIAEYSGQTMQVDGQKPLGTPTNMDGTTKHVRNRRGNVLRAPDSDRIGPSPGRNTRATPTKRSTTKARAKPKAKKASLLCRHLRNGLLRRKCPLR